MLTNSVQALHETAATHLKAGRIEPATQLLKQIADTYPNEPRSRFILGLLAQQAGQFNSALDWLNQAIRIDPAPAEPYFILGIAFQMTRQFASAIDAYRKFLTRRPGEARGLNNLGRCLLDSGNLTQAFDVLEKAILANPTHASLFSNLGDAYRARGDMERAMAEYRKAIQIDPRSVDAHGSLGIAFAKQGNTTEAVASIGRAIAINPRAFGPRFNLARVLQDAGRLEEALRECEAAIQLRPGSAEAYNLLGNLLGIAGNIPACIAAQRRAVSLKPDLASAHSNLLLSMQYLPEFSPIELFTAHREWAARHAPTWTNRVAIAHGEPTAGRRLRVGYLSPNFCTHSVAYFFEPVLTAHDRRVVEIFCYSDAAQPDATTDRLSKISEHWRDISARPDAEGLAILRTDRLDILVDLAGHTAGNRLPLFFHRPAAVQMTWIGYPATTGMSEMDYRITDPIADPPGVSDTLHTEKLLRMQGGCWVYLPPAALPIGAFPAIQNGYVTFGSFNNLPKVTPQVIQAWARILSLVPNSRLLLKCVGFNSKMGQSHVMHQFIALGISPDRIELLGWIPQSQSHLRMYDRIDLALDTFPYNGTTTTCEALWMGVPVITFAGYSHVSRVGAALLTHAGLTDWVADDVESYIALAVHMAGHIEGMQAIRGELRQKLQSSPLLDPRRLAGQLEAVYERVCGFTAG